MSKMSNNQSAMSRARFRGGGVVSFSAPTTPRHLSCLLAQEHVHGSRSQWIPRLAQSPSAPESPRPPPPPTPNRHKALKVFLQSFVVGVPHVFLGRRTPAGEVRSAEVIRTTGQAAPVHRPPPFGGGLVSVPCGVGRGDPKMCQNCRKWLKMAHTAQIIQT